MIRTRGELAAHWRAYTEDPNATTISYNSLSNTVSSSTPLGFILTMEGADPILTPDTVYEFHAAGLRALGLTHYGTNRYGGGTRSEVGLSLDAIELLKHCEKLGITIDVTHLSDVAFWQVIKNFDGPIHASHQNARAICNWQRQFSDEQIRVVIERGGVLGVALDIIMLQEGYVRGVTKNAVSLERAVDQIEHIRKLAGGSIANVGIGTDLDGGYGCEQTPVDLNRYSRRCLRAGRHIRRCPIATFPNRIASAQIAIKATHPSISIGKDTCRNIVNPLATLCGFAIQVVTK